MGKAAVVALGFAVVLVVVLILGGCSGSGKSDASQVVPEGKIVEYVGQGYEGERPMPAGLQVGTTMQTQGCSTHLLIGAPPKVASVPHSNINWFRIPAISVNKNLVVTLQPTANEDSDLYVLEGEGDLDYIDGVSLYGYSRRVPSGSDQLPYGYAPDWVAFNAGPVDRAASYVAVYGYHTPAGAKHFRIEADSLWSLQVNGSAKAGTLPEYDSHWYKFNVSSGTSYTVVVAGSGDPDIYLYAANSSGFIDSDTTIGGGSATFTATDSGTVYVRVHGYDIVPNIYTVEVNSP